MTTYLWSLNTFRVHKAQFITFWCVYRGSFFSLSLPLGIPERNLMTYDLSLLQAEVRFLIEIVHFMAPNGILKIDFCLLFNIKISNMKSLVLTKCFPLYCIAYLQKKIVSSV